MEFLACMPLRTAYQTILEHVSESILDIETIPLVDALGRIAAENITAKEEIPPFPRSSVDGFAVCSMDTFGASEAAPALLSVEQEITMGKLAAAALHSGQAAVIPTGGMLPPGADAVIMLEYTERPDERNLLVLKMAAPGENVVAKGEDIAAGTLLVKSGQRIKPQHIGALAACGIVKVPVRKKLTVAIISTGDELVDIDEVPTAAQLRDINSYALGAMLLEAGCKIVRLGLVKDSYDNFLCTLAQALEIAQLVIISGGSSVGARDYTVKAVSALGNPGVLFHGVAIKPGKPTIFAMIGKIPVFGLPGHPVAAMAVCQQLVKPAVSIIEGQSQWEQEYRVTAYLDRNVASAPGRDDFINVVLTYREGKYVATPVFGKSGLIYTMTQADGIMHIPADKSGLYAGERVEILPINTYGRR